MSPSEELSAAVNREAPPYGLFNLKGRIGPRHPAAAFPHPEGLIYLDIGWDTNDSGHPVHVLEGEVREAEDGDGWLIGDEWLVRKARTEDDDDLWDDIEKWRVWRNEDGVRATPEAALKAAYSSGLMK